MRISTSRGPGFCRLTSSITSGLLTSCRTAAFIGVSLVLSYVLVFENSGVSATLPFGQAEPDTRPRLSYLQQFANLGHADGALAEQMAGDRALRRIFREPERIVRLGIR